MRVDDVAGNICLTVPRERAGGVRHRGGRRRQGVVRRVALAAALGQAGGRLQRQRVLLPVRGAKAHGAAATNVGAAQAVEAREENRGAGRDISGQANNARQVINHIVNPRLSIGLSFVELLSYVLDMFFSILLVFVHRPPRSSHGEH